MFLTSEEEENRFSAEHRGHSGVYRPQFAGAGVLETHARGSHGHMPDGDIPAGVQRLSGHDGPGGLLLAMIHSKSSTPFTVLLSNLHSEATEEAVSHFLQPFKTVKVSVMTMVWNTFALANEDRPNFGAVKLRVVT